MLMRFLYLFVWLTLSFQHSSYAGNFKKLTVYCVKDEVEEVVQLFLKSKGVVFESTSGSVLGIGDPDVFESRGFNFCSQRLTRMPLFKPDESRAAAADAPFPRYHILKFYDPWYDNSWTDFSQLGILAVRYLGDDWIVRVDNSLQFEKLIHLEASLLRDISLYNYSKVNEKRQDPSPEVLPSDLLKGSGKKVYILLQQESDIGPFLKRVQAAEYAQRVNLIHAEPETPISSFRLLPSRSRKFSCRISKG